MQLCYITVMVRNMEKSLSFYRDFAGLKIVRRFNPGMGEIAFLENKAGDTKLELIAFPNAEKVQVSGMVMSYRAETDLETLREKAIEMGYEPTEIINCPPKPAHFRVTDPDGIWTEFSVEGA